MAFSQRHAPVRDEPVFLTPSEAGIVAQTTLLIIFSSWALGSTRTWAQDGLVGIVALGVGPTLLRWRERGAVPWRGFLPALLWLGFVTLALFNPSHTPGLRGEWLPRAEWIRWLPTTVDPARTFADARLWFAALVQGGFLSACLRRDRAVQILWGAIALNGFLLAALGACFHFAGAEQVLGFVDAPEPTYFFATFFYKNHWAAYGALTTVMALALVLRRGPAARAGQPTARGQMLLFGGAGLMTAVTLPLPGSRAGLLLATIIVIVFLPLIFFGNWRRSRGGSRRWPIPAALALVAIILGFGLHAYAPRSQIDLARTQQQFEKSRAGDALDVRLLLSRDTWRMAQTRLIWGWGPGCFEIVFPLYQGNSLRDSTGRSAVRFEAAHNDWLQLLAECGLVGAGLLLASAAMAGWQACQRAELAGRAALMGCGLIAVYAWIDFPFHNPAVLMLWTVLLTTAAQLRSHRHPPPQFSSG